MKYNVFVSYNSRDREQVEPFVRALQSLGYSVYFDKDNLPAGRFLLEEIDQHLNHADCVVVIWSKRSLKSVWVTYEASCGLNQKKLIPVLLKENAKLDGPFMKVSVGTIVDWDGDPASLDSRIVEGIKGFVEKAK